MGSLGMVEVVAGGSLCSGIVELRPACDQIFGFQFLQRSHDCASPSTGFGHECADRRVARKVFIGLFARRCKTNFVVGDPMSDSVAQSSAFQLMFAVWSKTSRGRPRCDALSYAAPCLSR